MSNQTLLILRDVREVESRYDPEHDLANGPAVTWSEMKLLEMIKRLVIEVEALQEQIDRLRE